MKSLHLLLIVTAVLLSEQAHAIFPLVDLLPPTSVTRKAVANATRQNTTHVDVLRQMTTAGMAAQRTKGGNIFSPWDDFVREPVISRQSAVWQTAQTRGMSHTRKRTKGVPFLSMGRSSKPKQHSRFVEERRLLDLGHGFVM